MVRLTKLKTNDKENDSQLDGSRQLLLNFLPSNRGLLYSGCSWLRTHFLSIPTLFVHTDAYSLLRPPYLGSQVGRRWAPAGRGRVGQHRAVEPLAAGACSSGPRLPWRQRRAGRVQIGSLVWRHQDLKRKGWYCWWRREPGWWPKGMMGPK